MLSKAVGIIVIIKKRWCGRDRSKEALVALPQSQEEEGMPWEGAPALAHAVLGLVFMEFSEFRQGLPSQVSVQGISPSREDLPCPQLCFLAVEQDQVVLER